MTESPLTWAALRDALTDVLPELAGGDVLVMVTHRGGPFVQFIQQPAWLAA